MPHATCPPWIGYLLASPIRRLLQKPEQILAGLITPGMKVLEIGPGMGFFTLPMARMVGPEGRVVCVDVQEAMLRGVQKRARAARLSDRVVTRVCPPDTLDLAEFAGSFDFALAFAVVHELPDQARFFTELAAALKPEARGLLAEPTGHVSAPAFEDTLAIARRAGLGEVSRPVIRVSRAAVLSKGR